jgi:hypothetical protein
VLTALNTTVTKEILKSGTVSKNTHLYSQNYVILKSLYLSMQVYICVI